VACVTERSAVPHHTSTVSASCL